MENKKTAIDYLINEFSEILGALTTNSMQDLLLVDAIKKAKQMEKEQIMDAYWDGGQDIPLTEDSCNEYYKETYEK